MASYSQDFLNLSQSTSRQPSDNGTAGSSEVKLHLTFADLPPEIRLRIWVFATQIPQIVSVIDGLWRQSLMGMHFRCPLLRVNWEARTEVLKSKVDFKAKSASEPGQNEGDRFPIYVNLGKDIIWLKSYDNVCKVWCERDCHGLHNGRDWHRTFELLKGALAK